MNDPTARHPARAALLALAIAQAGGCAGPSASRPGPASPGAGSLATTTADADVPVVPPAPAHQVASLDRKALGPFASVDAHGGIVAWVVPQPHGDVQDLVVVPVAPDGAPLRDAQSVAKVPADATSLVLERTGGKERGWIAAWSALLDRGESLSVQGIGPDGSARGIATDVQRTSDHVKWAAIVPTPRGSLCLWAEQTPSDDANLFVNALEPDGKARGMPMRVAHGVTGWQATPAGDGAALALVEGPPGSSDPDPRHDRPPTGALTWVRLDADGHRAAAPVVVATPPPRGQGADPNTPRIGPPSGTQNGTVIGSDVDVVPFRDGWLLAWTDPSGENPQVMLAFVDAAGRVQAPAPALGGVGGSSLLGLAANATGAVVAWTEPHAKRRAEREVGLALVSAGSSLTAQPLASLELAAGMPLELAGAGDGFALLGPGRACRADEATRSGRGCAGTVMPTFVRLGPQLDIKQSEPLFVGHGGEKQATIGWQLECASDGRCSALAASSESPTPVFLVDLAPRVSPFAPPLPPPRPVDAPRVTGLSTLASGAAYEEVAVAAVGGATVLATLAADAHDAPGAARVLLRAFDDAGHPSGPVRTMSSHAVPTGGLAMAAGPADDDGAALAWVAHDDGAPAVHVARLDRTAHATREVRLTRSKGDAGDVAIAWAGDGWLVAWVDARDGSGEVYAAKVDRDLRPVGHEQRITNAPGDAGGVTIAVSGDVAWAAWSDPRDNPREGVADIFATRLSPKDASRVGDEVRVLATAAHSRSPRIAALSDQAALVGWIEDAPTGLDGPGAAVVARLEPGATPSALTVGPPVTLPFPPGDRPSTLLLVPSSDQARAVVAHTVGDSLALDALRVAPDGKPASPPARLLELDAPPPFDTALALARGSLFYVDTGAPGGAPTRERSQRRVRRAVIDWRR